MVVVERKKGETKESAFRKFTRAFIEEQIVDEIRGRMFYMKPSQVRKEEEKLRRRGGKKRMTSRYGKPMRTVKK